MNANDPTNIDAIRVEISKDGSIVISGINGADLHTILTSAWLETHEARTSVKPLTGSMDDITHVSNMENAAWRIRQLTIIDILSGTLSMARNPQYSDGKNKIRSAKSDYAYRMKHLEETVRQMEQEAERIEQEKPTDHLEDVSKALQETIRQANEAFAKFQAVLNDTRHK